MVVNKGKRVSLGQGNCCYNNWQTVLTINSAKSLRTCGPSPSLQILNAPAVSLRINSAYLVFRLFNAATLRLQSATHHGTEQWSEHPHLRRRWMIEEQGQECSCNTSSNNQEHKGYGLHQPPTEARDHSEHQYGRCPRK